MTGFQDNRLDLSLTEAARSRISQMLTNDANNDFLRISVMGGGCSGMQYGFDLDNEKTEYDLSYTEDGINIIVDAFSRTYMIGASLDYQEGLMGSRFIINNPNAKTTCGCGGSFSY
mgnify:CR=1 FL=1